MSDNLKRYCAILRHLKTLAALICGIIGSKKVHLPAIASKSPDKSKRDSRAKPFARFLQNPCVSQTDCRPGR